MLNALLDFLFPPRCHACGGRVPGGTVRVCARCRDGVAGHDGPVCVRCGSPLEAGEECADCRGRDFAFDRARVLVKFNDTMQHLVHQVKYRHKRSLARDLGRLLGERLRKDGDYVRPDALVPVPLHRERRRTRGFNQSEHIARGLGAVIGVPVRTGLVKRMKNSRTQTGFNAAERQENVKGIFTAAGGTVPACVGIVDDVLTTGATVNECARALRAAGARSVQVFTLARA